MAIDRMINPMTIAYILAMFLASVSIVLSLTVPITPSEKITTHVYKSCPLRLEDKQIWDTCECIEEGGKPVVVRCWRGDV